MKKLLLFISVVFASCQGNQNTTSNDGELVADSSFQFAEPIEEVKKEPETQQVRFLKENGFKENANFTEVQFIEFKKTIQSGLFKEEDFCTVYQKGLKLNGNELKKYLNKYLSIPYFENMLFMYGPKVCNPYPDEHYSNTTSSANYQLADNACIMSEDFIKKDLRYPSSADFSSFDCSTQNNSDGSYTIIRKVAAKNGYGVESQYVYKVTLGFAGGNTVDINDWKLINIRSEEYR